MSEIVNMVWAKYSLFKFLDPLGIFKVSGAENHTLNGLWKYCRDLENYLPTLQSPVSNTRATQILHKVLAVVEVCSRYQPQSCSHEDCIRGCFGPRPRVWHRNLFGPSASSCPFGLGLKCWRLACIWYRLGVRAVQVRYPHH